MRAHVVELTGRLEQAEAKARDAPQHQRLELESLQQDLAQFKQVRSQHYEGKGFMPY